MTVTFRIPYGSMTIHLDTFLETARMKQIRDMFKLIGNPENWRGEKQNLSDIRCYLDEKIDELKYHPERKALLKKYEKLIQDIKRIGGEES